MKLILSLLIIISSTIGRADKLYDESYEEIYGSGYAEASGELPSEFVQMEFEDHEVNNLESGESARGRSGVTVTDMKDVVGAEFLISRRYPDTHHHEEEEKEEERDVGPCTCDCYEELKYHHDHRENNRQIDFVLQDQTRSSRVCSDEKYLECCKDFQSQARFRFPSEDPIFPDLGVSESVHSPGPPPHPQPEQTTEKPKVAADWEVVSQLQLGNNSQQLAEIIPSQAHWLLHFHLSSTARISVKLSSRSPVALLVSQNVRPRLKQFDLQAVLDGAMSVQMFDLRPGRWFLRLSNEEESQQEMLFTITARPSPSPHLACCAPAGGEAECHHGVRHLSQGCLCHPGWLGASCQLSLAQCSSDLCNARGLCTSDTQCDCQPGYEGSRCQTLRCPEDCGDNGVCQEGTCRCFSGWEGPACNTTSSTSSSERIETICPESFLQEQGAGAVCQPECGEGGDCVGGRCECSPGWTGEDCSSPVCDPRCSHHGDCQAGQCLCHPGWSGTHCTLDGCPGACSGPDHGLCVTSDHTWSCHCRPAWTGPDCSIQLETNCTDGRDNDGDRLVDCEDPECCYSDACSTSQYCSTVLPPEAIITNRPAPPPFASFFDRHKFLIEKDSLQKYAKLDQFDRRRASVIRGRVLTPSGQGLRGVRVSNGAAQKEGFTLTRADGLFDILVTAGKTINLKFGRSPFPYQTKNIFVPSNQIVVMDDIYLKLNKERLGKAIDVSSYCEDHVSSTRPSVRVLDNLKEENNLHTESLSLDPFKVRLVHSGGRQGGYTAVLEIDLLRHLPASLINIHTRIVVEGKQYEKVYEAEADLKVTFKWDGFNVYGMKHYGKAFVTIHVGYKYKLCHQILWQTLKTSVHGHIPLATDIGGWNLDLHHVYNPRDGIVYRGDGQNINLANRDKLVKAINENLSQTLVSPMTVITDEEGTIYVGDSQFVRKIDLTGKVTNLLQLNESTTIHKYYFALSHGKKAGLLMSDPVNRRIIRIPLSLTEPATLQDNFQVLAGSGELCTNTEGDDCGEGELAQTARLVYPKGLAVTVDNELIFVDGTNIRMLDLDNRVVTIAGLRKAATDWRPSRCGVDVRAAEANFNWPTELALNPVTGEITVVDQGAIFSLTREGRVRQELSNNCPGQAPLLRYSPSKISFSPDGDLVVADDNNILHKIDHNHRVEEVAGSLSYCKRSTKGCLQSDFDENLTVASKARFSSIGGIHVGGDGTIYIADSGKHLLRKIRMTLPTMTDSEEFQVISADTDEVFIFDREGRHLSTRGLFIDQATGLDFKYSGSGLVEVRDKSMNDVKIVRAAGAASNIVLSSGVKFHLKINKAGQLEQVISPSGLLHLYKYDSRSFITRKMLDRKVQYLYDYDNNGHLSKVAGLDISMSNVPAEKHKRLILRGENELMDSLYGEKARLNPKTIGYEQSGGEGGDVHRVQWEYFIHSARTRSSFSANVDGIGKRLLVNGEVALTSELHPRSRIRSLYDETGLQLLKVEMYAVPKRTILIPSNSFSHVDQTYDDLGRPEGWTWGQMVETLQYDKFSRIVNVSSCVGHQSYSYQYDESVFPSRRSDHLVHLDNTGALETIETPGGHRHQFRLVPVMGVFKLEFLPAWAPHTNIIATLSQAGLVSRLVFPGGPEVRYFSQGQSQGASCHGLEVRQETSGAGRRGTVEGDGWRLEEEKYINGTTIFHTLTAASPDQASPVQSQTVCEYEKYQSRLDCLHSVDGRNVSVRTSFSKITNQVTEVGDFQLIRSLQSQAWLNNKWNIVLKTERASSGGKVSKKEVTVNNVVVLTSALEYNCAGQVLVVSRTLTGTQSLHGNQRTEFSYNKQGMVGLVKTNGVESYNHQYDLDGNLKSWQHSTGKISFSHEAGQRVRRIEGGERDVTYTTTGALASRDGYSFTYNCLNQLTAVSYAGRRRREIVYDVRGRPVLVRDLLAGADLRLVYGLQDWTEWQVVAWLGEEEDSSSLHSVSYDNEGAVMAVESEGELLLVLTDQTNTPNIILDHRGSVLKVMEYSPYGFLVDDTNQDMRIPIGYHGGVDLQEAGIVIIQGRPYDSLLGQWMVPDYEAVLKLPNSYDVTDIHLYRFNKNDPLNTKKLSYMNKLEDWLTFFGYDLNKIGQSVLQSTLDEGLKIPRLAPAIDDDSKDLLNPNIQRPIDLASETRNVALARSFHLSPPVFPNVIISREEEDVILARLIEGASPVEAMMAELVNKTIVLRNYGDPEIIYFVKSQGIEEQLVTNLKKYVDIQERLIEPHGREICFKMVTVELCGLSGSESVEERYLQPSSSTASFDREIII